MVAKPETHLFIVWERALIKEQAILTDLQNKFKILARYRISWSQEIFHENLNRFYGKKLPAGSFKEKECGTGPFLLVIVEDQNPKYEMRQTSKGPASVNINLFDAKELYRSWTGGGHKIHATNDQAEYAHDAALLLGDGTQVANGISSETIELKQDLVGARGWESITQLFKVLNQTLNYVVLRNFEGLPEEALLKGHQDIDLLAADLNEAVLISNGCKVFSPKHRVHFHIKINNQVIPFDFRFLGDNYYDMKWQRDMLSTKVFQSVGFYTCNQENYFYSLLYHALIHKKEYAHDYQQRLAEMAANLGIVGESLLNTQSALRLLQKFLAEHEYTITEPKDYSVYLNNQYYPLKNFSIKRKLRFYFSEKIVKPAKTKLQF